MNPHRIDRVFVFATSSAIRAAAQQVDQRMAYCEVFVISDPSDLDRELHDRTSVLFVDEGAIPFLDHQLFKRRNPACTVVLLSADIRLGSAPTQSEIEQVCPLVNKADLVFYINENDCRPALVMPAIARYVEDSHNIAYHTRARRFIFLVVDDELRWFSQFLPVLYRIIGTRADVILARTFEEATRLMHEHGNDIVCLITDMFFPKGGVVSAEAGRELVLATKQCHPRIPIIIASKEERGKSLQDIALLLPKGDPEAIETLDQHVHDFTGLGDFLFFDGATLWRRASTLAELRDAVAEAPIGMLEEYAAKDYFSTWFHMHGFRSVGEFLRPLRDQGERLRQVLLSVLDEQLELVEQQELVLVDEDGTTVARAHNVEDLLRVFEQTDVETLTAHALEDVFSMWVMLKGHPDLADQLRPIHGEGQDLKAELTEVMRRWLAERSG